MNLHSVSIDPERIAVTAPEVAITKGSGRTDFGVSPDGQSMVFAKDDVLYVARLVDGSGMHPVSGPGVRPRGPSWSPDGSHIVFQADYEGRSVIWTVAADGSELKKAVEGTGDVGAAVWDPHGARLAYSDFSTEPARVRIRTLNTGAEEVLPALDASRGFRPGKWSSDGERLAGWVRGGGGIVVYSFRDRTYTQLTRESDGDPAWLPDGRHLLFTSDDHPGKLMIVDRIARTTQALEGMGADVDPAFGALVAPGGRHVFFARVHAESDLWMLRRR